MGCGQHPIYPDARPTLLWCKRSFRSRGISRSAVRARASFTAPRKQRVSNSYHRSQRKQEPSFSYDDAVGTVLRSRHLFYSRKRRRREMLLAKVGEFASVNFSRVLLTTTCIWWNWSIHRLSILSWVRRNCKLSEALRARFVRLLKEK